MKFFREIVLLSCFIVMLPVANASKKEDGWSGSAELGLITTRGNTETTSSNARFTVNYRAAPWEHQLDLQSLRTEESGAITADRSEAKYHGKYNFTDKSYYFGILRYEDDPFAGYDQRTTEVVGLGHTFYDTDTITFDVELGAGGRQTEFVDTTDLDETIYHLGADFGWAISKTSSFRQALTIEGGDENTVTESTTELKVKINSALAMKATINVIDNSDVPVGTKNTDTTSSVTLVYDF